MINWTSFGLVAGASLAFTMVIVITFSLGVRLLTNAENHASRGKKMTPKDIRLEMLNRSSSYVLFALCVLALLYGIWLVIPSFHV